MNKNLQYDLFKASVVSYQSILKLCNVQLHPQ